MSKASFILLFAVCVVFVIVLVEVKNMRNEK